MSQSAFERALSDFVHDFASGDAIDHLADQGMTVTEIKERLSFPTKKERVADRVWKHYLEKGIICTELPESGSVRKVSYVQEHGKYGKVSLRQVSEEVELPAREYVPCSFGKERYRDRKAFEKRLEVLSPSDREYILDLPWPLQTVWHVKDERMSRILDRLKKEE